MNIFPLNRYILVEPVIENNPEESVPILVPSNYKPEVRYGRAKVLEAAEDCKLLLNMDDVIIIDNSMLQEIEIAGGIKYLILENHVLGVLE